MSCVNFAALLWVASLTAIAFAQSANGSTSRAPSWAWPYLQVYPPVSADEAVGETKSLYFALMMSFSGNAKSSGTIPGVQAALDGINSDPTLLPGYKLHYTLTDSQCDRTVALDEFFKQIIHYPVKIALIGSGCSVATTPTAEISHQYNITQISCISATPELGHRQRLRYYFQMQPTAEQLGLEFFAIITQFQWRRVAIIEQNENLFTVATARMKVLLTQAGITFTVNIFNTEEGIEGLGLQPFDPQSRIFIITSYSQHARRILCKAYQSGMRYPHYMFVTAVLDEGSWWKVVEEEDECTPEERESILHYTLAITQQFDFHCDPNATTDTGINGYQYKALYKAHRDSSPLDVDKNRTDEHSQHCYDATWALAFALNKTIMELQENLTLNADVWKTAGLFGNGTFPLDNFYYNNSALLDVIFKQAHEINFKGITGNVAFDSVGIRNVHRLTVYQYRYVDEILQLVEIGNVLENSSEFQFIYLPGVEDNLWPGGNIPYDGIPLEQDVTVAIPLTATFSFLALVGIAFSVVCLAFNCIFRKKKLIRLSSPNLNYLIVGGAILLTTCIPGGNIPYDGIPLEQDVTVAIPLTATFSFLALVGIAFSVVCLAFNCIFRKKKLIRLSSPNLNYLIVGGAILLYIAIYFFIIPTTDPHAVVILCNITPWLYALGYSFCYGTILVKMVRVYYILDKPSGKKTYSLQDWHLFAGVLTMVLIDLIILIIYIIVEGVQGNITASRVPNRENPMDVDGVLTTTTLYFTYICASTARDIFLGILYGYKMMLQIIALVLALSMRKVKVKGLNDAKYIAAAIYATSIEVAIIIICIYTLSGFVNGFVAVIGTVDFLGTTFTLGLVFVPKMVNLYKDPEGKAIFAQISDPPHQGSSQQEDVQTVKSLKTRIAELEAALSHINQTQVRSLEARIVELETALSHMNQVQTSSTKDKIRRPRVSVLIMDSGPGSSLDSNEDTTSVGITHL